MKGVAEKHEETVDWLVERLEASGKFTWVNKDVPYSANGETGQVDVLACIEGDISHVYFYEIKSSFSAKNKKKAREQYQRYRRAFPDLSLEGYLVTKDIIERLDT